ncbi:hypothetical protein MKX01_034495 [Papaver californicum]|nr:hypothetical protein MKX01_034495 [Papaver californicum]
MDGRFWELLEEASMPVLEVLIITVLGAFMATKYCNLLSADARKHMNKTVFVVFSPALVFACLSKTVTLQDIISWWFMPINIGLTFLLGGILVLICLESFIGRHMSTTGKIRDVTFLAKLKGFLHLIVEELLTPPTIAAVLGLIFGAVTWLKNLIIGDDAPLRVIQDSVTLLGNGAIPCITLILGGNLTQGLRSSKVKPLVVIGIICVKYMILPIIGIGVVKAAEILGLLPAEKLFQYVLMIQFSLPPAMNVGTIAQLFDVGQDECSIILLWTYLVAALALTTWSTVFLYVLA